jgi:hypothetical protein
MGKVVMLSYMNSLSAPWAFLVRPEHQGRKDEQAYALGGLGGGPDLV